MKYTKLNCKQIHDALDVLAEFDKHVPLRDGLHFDQADSSAGHYLARLPASVWSEDHYDVALNLLSRYRQQLGSLIDWHEQPVLSDDELLSVRLNKRLLAQPLIDFSDNHFIVYATQHLSNKVAEQILDSLNLRQTTRHPVGFCWWIKPEDRNSLSFIIERFRSYTVCAPAHSKFTDSHINDNPIVDVARLNQIEHQGLAQYRISHLYGKSVCIFNLRFPHNPSLSTSIKSAFPPAQRNFISRESGMDIKIHSLTDIQSVRKIIEDFQLYCEVDWSKLAKYINSINDVPHKQSKSTSGHPTIIDDEKRSITFLNQGYRRALVKAIKHHIPRDCWEYDPSSHEWTVSLNEHSRSGLTAVHATVAFENYSSALSIAKMARESQKKTTTKDHLGQTPVAANTDTPPENEISDDAPSLSLF